MATKVNYYWFHHESESIFIGPRSSDTEASLQGFDIYKIGLCFEDTAEELYRRLKKRKDKGDAVANLILRHSWYKDDKKGCYIAVPF